MKTSDLTDDQKERLRECTDMGEFMSLLVEDGVELSDEQMDAIVGGYGGEWSLEGFSKAFGDIIRDVMPEGFDAIHMWKNVPYGIH